MRIAFPKAITLAALAPLMLGATGLSTALDARLLAAHNRERASMGVPALRWNERLAADAAGWARHLAATNAFEHADVDEGENLWAGTAGHYTPEAMVGLWIAEKRDFKPGAFPANSRTGSLGDVGHYTQLMWRRTGEVGCAVARNDADEILVCRYAEAGNVIGERPF